MNSVKETYRNVNIFIDDSNHGFLQGITSDHNGNVIVCGHDEDFISLRITKFDNVLRDVKQEIVLRDEKCKYFYGITVDSDNVFVCGMIDYDFCIVKLNSSLNLIKQVIVDIGEATASYGMATDYNGNVFVCGSHDKDFYIAKLNNDLNIVKQITINNDGDGIFRNLATDCNGNVFVCGYINTGILNNGLYIAKFDNDLNVIKQMVIESGKRSYLIGITIDDNGNVFVCGKTCNECYVAKIANDLNHIKQIAINGGKKTDFHGISTDPHGNVFVCGQTKENLSSNLCVAKFDNNLLLVKHVVCACDGVTISRDGLTIDSNGNVFTCGTFHSDFVNTPFIIKFNDNLDYPDKLKAGSYTFTFSEPTWISTVQDYPVTVENWVPIIQNWIPRVV